MSKTRNIQSIAPFFADDFIDLDEPIFDTDEYSKFLSQNSDRLGTFKKYLICKLHDSWVIDFEIASDKLTISLNDFCTHVFSDAIIEKNKIEIDHDKLVFPVVLELKGSMTAEFNKVDEDGLLHKIDKLPLDEYLYEQVTRVDDNQIEIVFQFWHTNENDDIPGESIVLIVSADQLNLIEKQDQAWNEIFGNKYDEYYQYFKTQFERDRDVSSYGQCLKLIEEYKKKQKEKIKKPTA